MAQLGNVSLGFDVHRTPIGSLSDHSAYAMGYENFTLDQLTDGYIFTKPLEEQTGCTVDYDFLQDHTLQEIQGNFPDPEWHAQPDSLEAYWKHVEAFVDIKKRHGMRGEKNGIIRA